MSGKRLTQHTEMDDSDRHFPAAVSPERWREAQQWELAFWNRQNLPSPFWKRLIRPLLVVRGLRAQVSKTTYDDRNEWWRKQFDNYSFLPPSSDNVCELGCGPYTNMRLILEGMQAKHVHCSDPLARSYMSYPNAWLGAAARAARVCVDYHPAEECPYASDYFDLVVMINVLDHVRDARRCLEHAIRITRTGGLLLFGQDLTLATDEQPGNPGHPFILNHQQLEPVLLSRFKPVLKRIVPRAEVSEPEMHYGALVFAGRKLSADHL